MNFSYNPYTLNSTTFNSNEDNFGMPQYIPMLQYNISTSNLYNISETHMQMNLINLANMYCMCDSYQHETHKKQMFAGKWFGNGVSSSYEPDKQSGSSFSGCYNHNDQMFHSKNEVNLRLLKDYNYTTRVEKNDEGKSYTVYCCQHPGCDKEFLRTNNLLDHVRMHAGIKPFSCKFCSKNFTQKSNLKKHLKMHFLPDLEQRKRYKCDDCGACYTERYNYKVRIGIYIQKITICFTKSAKCNSTGL